MFSEAPLEKLNALLEDIFEAEDSISPDANTTDDEISEYFSQLTMDIAHPLLNTNTIAKLTLALSQVARPTKRIRLTARDGNNHLGGVAGLDPQNLSRVLKLLERSVRVGEDLDPFAGPVAASRPKVPSTPKKPKARRKTPGSRTRSRSKSDTPQPIEEDVEGVGADASAKPEPPKSELGPGDFEELDKALAMAKESVLAADSCIALLSADKLPKQVC